MLNLRFPLSSYFQGSRLPTDNVSAGGQVTVPVDTLSGAPLTAIASSSGVSLQDGNASTPDAKILRAVRVCNSVIDLIDAVPLPF